jgi:myosin heavy subunit
MARPLPAPTSIRGGTNGSTNGRPTAGALLHAAAPEPPPDAADEALDEVEEIEQLREENTQLRSLCLELEQALHESATHGPGTGDERVAEYEALLDEKTEIIRQQAEHLQQLQADAEEKTAARSANSGPAPREDDLLALSEELERERRQLQEDEQSVMQQMREMEVSMAKERAEMARQRNDMQRLQSEVRHELERLERNGALESKIESLKNKLTDATTRRGAAHSLAHGQPAPSIPAAPTPPAPTRKESLLGRLFGGGK